MGFGFVWQSENVFRKRRYMAITKYRLYLVIPSVGVAPISKPLLGGWPQHYTMWPVTWVMYGGDLIQEVACNMGYVWRWSHTRGGQ